MTDINANADRREWLENHRQLASLWGELGASRSELEAKQILADIHELEDRSQRPDSWKTFDDEIKGDQQFWNEMQAFSTERYDEVRNNEHRPGPIEIEDEVDIELIGDDIHDAHANASWKPDRSWEAEIELYDQWVQRHRDIKALYELDPSTMTAEELEEKHARINELEDTTDWPDSWKILEDCNQFEPPHGDLPWENDDEIRETPW